MTVIFGLVALIGWVDYVSGFWVSLQFFYLIPITLSVAWLGWRVACGITVVCVCVRLWGDIAAGIFHYLAPATVLWNRLVDLCGSVLLIWVVHTLITLQRQLDQRVRERTAELEQAIFARNQLQSELFEISRRERSAIGHDLHDGLGQHLTATTMATDLLASRLAARHDPVADDARAIVRMLQDCIAQTRRIARGLLLAEIEPDQLLPELEELVGSVTQEPRIACRFVSRGEIRVPDTATASHLFYIAREAVHNALRHAQASRLDLSLTMQDAGLTLILADNGCGLPSPNSPKTGMGLRIMAHRSELIGAQFSIEAAPGGGTIMRCCVPLPRLPAPKISVAHPVL